ncbi:uncharacterized protein LOC111629319 isoform X1 [Centruroides sculpturatus]|uniref:uncharacterized protein LOC111629319 isoform X1 n=1 Tax=Centruroides sculpturatus TaxID=218467 RepID=UPI000C6D4945|nr:uncharacterized protein LOC111629319 isoform X1 [Centruroides sculpturatus]XP_023228972.1 uncharacterized protein LOC111629319 isoform X1 [Centruroides sculpturatus]
MKIFIFCVTFLTVGAVETTNKCRLQILADCVLTVSDFIKNLGNPFPSNEEELKEQCRMLETERNCMYNFSHNCMTSMDRIVGDFIFSGTMRKMKDFCDPQKQFYKDYVKETSCIKSNFKRVKSCFEENLNSVVTLYQSSSTDKLLTFCCGLNRLRSCIVDYYKERCNEKVATLMDFQIEFLFAEWILELCSPYLNLKNECPVITTKYNPKEISISGFLIKYLAPYS